MLRTSRGHYWVIVICEYDIYCHLPHCSFVQLKTGCACLRWLRMMCVRTLDTAAGRATGWLIGGRVLRAGAVILSREWLVAVGWVAIAWARALLGNQHRGRGTGKHQRKKWFEARPQEGFENLDIKGTRCPRSMVQCQDMHVPRSSERGVWVCGSCGFDGVFLL